MGKSLKWKSGKRLVKDLQPAEYNPRRMTEKQKKDLCESINRFDLADPIVINTNDRVIGGHQRLKILAEKGVVDVDVRIPSRKLTLKEERELNVRLNKNLGEWDWDLLADFDMDMLKDVGFDSADLDKIIDGTEADGEDDVPPMPKEPKTKRGEIYLLGKHRLMCGDATDSGDVEMLMAGKKAGMCFTDPPYNVSIGTIKHKKFKQREIANDSMSDDEYAAFSGKIAGVLKSNVTGCVYVCGGQHKDGRILFSQLDSMLHASTTIIWLKDTLTLGRGKYHNKYEPIWFGWVVSGKKFTTQRNLTNVFEIPRPKKSEEHPTMKPVELVMEAIGHASIRGDVVFDMFMGSGTTLIACQRMERVCYGMELDPKYCDVIINRWEKFTGGKAKRSKA